MATPPLELFFSYSHRDQALRDELARHLAILERQRVISGWHDRRIGAGNDWAGAIDAHLSSARIILLLISADFLSSDYCYDREMAQALARHDAGDARVIPVLLRAVDWHGAPFSHLQMVPSGALPVTSWANRDEAFADIVRAIRDAATELNVQLSRQALHTPSSVTVKGDTQLWRFAEDRARDVVGRGYVTEALDRFIAAHAHGYFFIEGGPGQGKTAIAARIVASRRLVHHFVGRTGRRSDPNVILGRLIAQLEYAEAPAIDAGASLDALSARFEVALRNRASAAATLVVVFDGLNELGVEAADLGCFPDELPDGVYIVVTSQPGIPLAQLKERVAGVPSQVYPLGPLRDSEVREVITARQPGASAALIGRIARAAAGNPLYLRATLDMLVIDSRAGLGALPEAIEGYFRRATRGVTSNPLLRDVLGLLTVSRRDLSLLELSELTGAPQRAIHESAIAVIRPFLTVSSSRYTLYHERFHDFVVRELFYEDELRRYNAQMAKGLQDANRSSRAMGEEYWTSLAYHLFHAGDTAALLDAVSDQFLAEKLRRFGYAVLEDLELLTVTLLDTSDPASIERCVQRLDGLMGVVGPDAVDQLARAVAPRAERVSAARRRFVVPTLPQASGLDVYAALYPKHDVTADFVEVVARDRRITVAIGDAPRRGLQSAFVARFIATLFRALVSSAGSTSLDQILGKLSVALRRHPHFERVSAQCADLRLDEGVIALASAGHPYPLLYSARYGRCDQLPVRGPLLHDGRLESQHRQPYRERLVEIGSGDVLVLVSDGFLDAGPADDPFGYRFAALVERHAREGARQVGEIVIDEWHRHLAGEAPVDDASIVVIAVETADRTESASDH